MRKLGTIAVLMCGLLCGCPENKPTGAGTTPPSNTGTAPDTTKSPAGADTKSPGPAASTAADSGSKTTVENFWKDVGVGTVAEYNIVTDMKKPVAMKTESGQKQTLTAKDDKGYTVKMDTIMNGASVASSDMKAEWAVATGSGGDAAAKPQDMGEEKITTPAGDFTCKHWKMSSETAGIKTTSETWTMKNLVVKSVTTNDNMVSTMTLTKLDKK